MPARKKKSADKKRGSKDQVGQADDNLWKELGTIGDIGHGDEKGGGKEEEENEKRYEKEDQKDEKKDGEQVRKGKGKEIKQKNKGKNKQGSKKENEKKSGEEEDKKDKQEDGIKLEDEDKDESEDGNENKDEDEDEYEDQEEGEEILWLDGNTTKLRHKPQPPSNKVQVGVFVQRKRVKAYYRGSRKVGIILRKRKVDVIPRTAIKADYRSSRKMDIIQHKSAKADQNGSQHAEKKSLLSRIMEDCRDLILYARDFVSASYSFWRWAIPIYVGWMIITHSVAFLHHSIMSTLAPACSIPILGPQLPFCTTSVETGWRTSNSSQMLHDSIMSTLAPACSIPILGPRLPFCPGGLETRGRTANFSQMLRSQEGFMVVLDHVGQHVELGKGMNSRELAVRDLRIRVEASKLPRKEDLDRELRALSRLTIEAARAMSRFKVRVGGSVDMMTIFNGHAAKDLQEIAERQRHRPSLLYQILSVISPWSAFSIGEVEASRGQVKRLFNTTTAEISEKVTYLINESYSLINMLDEIYNILERINQLTTQEVGDLPRRDVLSALWTRLARSDNYHQLKSNGKLLKDITEFYEVSSTVTKRANRALINMDEELRMFRDTYGPPRLTIYDESLESNIKLFRRYAERLDTGLKNLEEGTASGVKTVTATIIKSQP